MKTENEAGGTYVNVFKVLLVRVRNAGGDHDLLNFFEVGLGVDFDPVDSQGLLPREVDYDSKVLDLQRFNCCPSRSYPCL